MVWAEVMPRLLPASICPLVDGADAGAHDFRHVGAGEDCQRRHPGREAIQIEYSADKEIDDEDLHQQRGAADKLP